MSANDECAVRFMMIQCAGDVQRVVGVKTIDFNSIMCGSWCEQTMN